MTDTPTDETLSLATETMIVDMTGAILDRIKNQSRPWQQMSHGEQSMLIDDIRMFVGNQVKAAIRTIAADGRKVIVAKCEKVAFTDKGVQAVLMASTSSEFRHDLADARGLDVLVVVADAGAYAQGDMPAADAPKDGQPGLPLDDKPVFDSTRAGAAA